MAADEKQSSGRTPRPTPRPHPAADESTAQPPDAPSFAEKALGKLRSIIESGQVMIGGGGPGSDNGIVQPLRRLAEQEAQAQAAAAAATEVPADTLPTDHPQGDNPSMLPRKASAPAPAATSYASRDAHAAAQKAHAAARALALQQERARHEKERHDKLVRYIALIVCIVVIILSLLGMAALSRRVIGKWWHGAPDPAPEPTPDPGKISHSVLFPQTHLI